MVGGPPRAGPTPVSGTVTLSGPAGTFAIKVGIHGKFTEHLPVGAYAITGLSPWYFSGRGRCLGSEVHIHVGGVTRALVACSRR